MQYLTMCTECGGTKPAAVPCVHCEAHFSLERPHGAIQILTVQAFQRNAEQQNVYDLPDARTFVGCRIDADKPGIVAMVQNGSLESLESNTQRIPIKSNEFEWGSDGEHGQIVLLADLMITLATGYGHHPMRFNFASEIVEKLDDRWTLTEMQIKDWLETMKPAHADNSGAWLPW